MKFRISSFADTGDLQRERLVLRAVQDADIGDYLIMCSDVSSTTADAATAGRKLVYWFPDREVKAGDSVVLYTKSGTSGVKKLEAGGTAYFYYWGLEKPLWVVARKNGAVLLHVSEWQFTIFAK